MGAMSTESPVEPGQILADKFRVERVLGVGGMGIVLEATHLALKQRVALKFLLPAALADKGAVARFEREARAAVQLKSEHVVKVMDVGRMPDGAPFMVMEYLEGVNLSEIIRDQEQLPIPVVLNYLLQMCEAVSEAHRLGIIHRDLKPENIFITTNVSGEPLVKVLDFGISKMNGEQMSLTHTTQVLGSPYYMSPEQLRSSRDVDQRSDVWAIGAILYEMLSGHVPFEANTMMELCTQVLESTPPPLSNFRSDIPPEMVSVVEGCLAKQRDDRLASVAEIVRRLGPPPGQTGRYLLPPPEAHSGITGRSTMPVARGIPGGTATSWDALGVTSKRKRMPWIIGGAVIVAGLALSLGGVLAFTHHDPVVTTPVPSAPTTGAANTGTVPIPIPSSTQVASVPAPTDTASAPATVASVVAPPLTSGHVRPGRVDAAAPSASASSSATAPPSATGTTDDIPNVR